MQLISPVKQRILQYVDTLGISKRDFYAKATISRGTLEAPSGITEETVAKFIVFAPEINPTWLLTGEGMMLRSKNGHQEKKYVEVQEPITAFIPGEGTVEQFKRIPLVSPFAVAGFGNGDFSVSNSDIKDYYVVPLFKDRKIDFMIEVSGSSMYPKYNNGDVVACGILRESRFIQWNKVHLIGTREQGILIKRIKKGNTDQELLLVSDNKEFEPFAISMSEVTGMALIVGVIRLE